MLRWKQLTQSLFFKFSASFILVGLVPLSLLSYYAVQSFTSHVERYTTNNLRQMVLYMSYNVNSALTKYDDISKLMYTGRYDGYVEGSDENQTRKVNELEQINSVPIESFLKTILYSDPFIRNVYFVRSSDMKLYYQLRTNSVLIPEALPLQDWLSVMKERPRNIAYFAAHDETYLARSDKQVVTIGRNLIDISLPLEKEPHVVGTLFFDVSTDMFNQFFPK